jgi:hypothetical protein
MQIDENIYDDETLLKIKNNLNTNHSTELAELVEMTFGAKPDNELQRLTSAHIIAIGPFGLRLQCTYHRWETAEKNNRMFHEHTDETTRIFTVPFSTQPHSKNELLLVIEKMINDAKASYLKGFE